MKILGRQQLSLLILCKRGLHLERRLSRWYRLYFCQGDIKSISMFLMWFMKSCDCKANTMWKLIISMMTTIIINYLLPSLKVTFSGEVQARCETQWWIPKAADPMGERLSVSKLTKKSPTIELFQLCIKWRPQKKYPLCPQRTDSVTVFFEPLLNGWVVDF